MPFSSKRSPTARRPRPSTDPGCRVARQTRRDRATAARRGSVGRTTGSAPGPPGSLQAGEQTRRDSLPRLSPSRPPDGPGSDSRSGAASRWSSPQEVVFFGAAREAESGRDRLGRPEVGQRRGDLRDRSVVALPDVAPDPARRLCRARSPQCKDRPQDADLRTLFMISSPSVRDAES